MADVKLTGLKASNAHGFLAALGVMEALHAVGADASLSWSVDLFPHAVLSTPADYELLVPLLLDDRDRRLSGAVLNYPPGSPFDTLGCSAAELTSWARHVGELSNHHPDVNQWSGLVIEGGFTNKGDAKPTHFDFSTGQVKFLKCVRLIAQALSAKM